jgi:hypothetical protein
MEFQEVSMARAFDLELERRWRQRLREFERAGLSVRDFCRAESVPEYTFFYWRRELAKRDQAPQTARSRSRLRDNQRRERRNGKAGLRAEPSERTPAFVPVQLISEPLGIGTACLELRFGPFLVRMPVTIAEPALRQVIRVLRQEAAAC